MKLEESIRLFLRYGAGAAVAFASLPSLILGGAETWKWLRLQFGEPFYGNRDYLGIGLPVFLVGLVLLASIIFITVRRRVSAGWLLVPFTVSVMASIAIPALIPGQDTHQGRVRADLEYSLKKALFQWAEQNGRFPQTEQQLALAVEDYRKSRNWPKLVPSPYAHRGEPLPYRLVYLADATGPHIPDPVPQQPGVIYCAVSQDGTKSWLTATVLEQEVGTSVVLLRTRQGEPDVVEGSLDTLPEVGQR